MNYKKAKLILKNGMVFNGISLGHIGETIGEICFNTGMTGYQEILTDPSYCGQIINMTFPHIGNYGINQEDIESVKIQASGFIVREANEVPSNYRSIQSLNNYLKENEIVGIQEVDTRMITRIIRDEGSMNAIISSDNLNENYLIDKLNSFPSMKGMDLVKCVSTKKKYLWRNSNDKKYRVAVIDFGIKFNILRLLESFGCYCKVFPADTSSNEILKFNPDGIFLSNGPGDPSAVTYAINTIKFLIGKRPIFGICLGHQILCLALGAQTFKLKFGHRGCNHPVKNLNNGLIEITSQNHGFSVLSESLPSNIKITHISLNDHTVEGISCESLNVFSVQYHPESSPGPHDSRYLFKSFIKMMNKNVYA
tara:strand:- start:796 stop:1893 length:1098 start_codon:yes stop_codon:yes gene_type:complete